MLDRTKYISPSQIKRNKYMLKIRMLSEKNLMLISQLRKVF